MPSFKNQELMKAILGRNGFWSLSAEASSKLILTNRDYSSIFKNDSHCTYLRDPQSATLADNIGIRDRHSYC